jgi:hypothetical protein
MFSQHASNRDSVSQQQVLVLSSTCLSDVTGVKPGASQPPYEE